MNKYEDCRENCIGCNQPLLSDGNFLDVRFNNKVTHDLCDVGFACFDRNDLNFTNDEVHKFHQIRSYANTMPIDHTDGGAGRARLYGKAIIMPWKEPGEDIEFIPGQQYDFNGEWGLEYTQPASVNVVAGGKRRIFKPFPKKLYENPLIEKWTRKLWSYVDYKSELSQGLVAVGYHLVRLAPGEKSPAVASPDLVHRDGEWFTAGILIERDNVIGGENAITKTKWHSHSYSSVPRNEVISEFILDEPLEGYIVADDKVAHYVGPVHRDTGNIQGNRTILLIDFTPYCPDLNLHGIEN